MLLSVGLEVPVLVGLAWAWRTEASLARLVGVGVLATTVTHPFVWHGIPALAHWIPSWPIRAGIAEVGAWLAEAAVFAGLLRWQASRALLASGAANAWSFGVGLAWFFVVQPLLARGPDCPDPLVADPERAEHIVALAGVSAPPMCFGRVPEGGVRDASGHLRLHAGADDRWLAARLVHLAHHATPPAPGPQCEPQLRHEEAEGWKRELTHRVRLGVVSADCPVEAALGREPSVAAIEAWIATSDHPRATGLRQSHRTRCHAR